MAYARWHHSRCGQTQLSRLQPSINLHATVTVLARTWFPCVIPVRDSRAWYTCIFHVHHAYICCQTMRVDWICRQFDGWFLVSSSRPFHPDRIRLRLLLHVFLGYLQRHRVHRCTVHGVRCTVRWCRIAARLVTIKLRGRITGLTPRKTMTVKRIMLWSADRKPGAPVLTRTADGSLQDATDHSPPDQTMDVDPWQIDVSSRDGLIILPPSLGRLPLGGFCLPARPQTRACAFRPPSLDWSNCFIFQLSFITLN